MSTDLQVALDSLRMLGVVIDEDQLTAFVVAMREFDRLDHCFDKATGLRFEDFARRDHGRALTSLRLISDLAQSRDEQNEKARFMTAVTTGTILDDWRDTARRWGFES